MLWGLGGVFFEGFGEVALGGEAQIIGDKGEGFIAVAEQAFGLLNLFAQNKIGKSHAGFLSFFK